MAQNQNLPLKLTNPLIVSPGAAAFAKYGDIPVSASSGIPSILIPLYSVATGDISIPITLSYHASGIRVEEIASNAGLGWNLQATGNITRMVRGLPDESPGYDHTTIDRFISSQMSQAEMQNFLTHLRLGQVDGEADIFYYTLPNGQSGKFFQAGNGKYVTMPESNLVISGGVNDNWTITDDNGIKYYFSVYDQSHTITTTSVNASPSVDGPEFSGRTAWYVNKVIDTKGNQVNFYYSASGSTYQTKDAMTKKILTSKYDFGSFTIPTEQTSTSSTTNSVVSNHLQKITWSNGALDFSYDLLPRKDLPGDSALASVTVSNSRGAQVKKFNLYTSYFQNAPSRYSSDASLQYRLRLDSVKEIAATGALNAPYIFKYAAITLPDRLSDNQDHWGYYNGKENFPTMVTYYQNVLNKPQKMGANRDVDPAYSQANSLQQIQYPTGGTTSFVFENNTCHQYRDTFYTNNPDPIAAINGNDSSNDPNQYRFEFTQPFTVAASMVVMSGKARIQAQTIATINNPNGYVCTIVVAVYDQSGTKVQDLYDPLNANAVLLLSPGNYVLKGSIETEYAHQPFASIGSNLYATTMNLPGYYNEYAGGLRVKKIINNDGIAISGTKEYVYDKRGANYSSGSIGYTNRLPEYGITEVRHSYTVVGTGGSQVGVYHDDTYQSYSASSNFPLLTSGGGYVTYSNVDVIERDLSGKAGGKTEYTYTSFDDKLDEINTAFPFPPPCSYEWKRGLILNEKKYKSTGDNTYTLLNEKRSDYLFLENGDDATRKVINGVKGASREFWDYPYTNDPLLNAALTVSAYHTAAEYYWLKTDTSITYSTGDASTALSSYNLYSYRTDPFQLILVQGKNSKGELVSSGLKYPADFSSTAPYNLMVQNNQLRPVVQQSDSVNTLPVRVTQSVYADWGNSIFLPQKLKAQVLSNALEDRLWFNLYDQKGNILEQQKAGDVKEVYFWGYNAQYPVAKVVGSDYNTAKQYIDQNILDNASNYSDDQIRTQLGNLRVNLPQCLVTTFTYNPLIGITSETGPTGKVTYYEYDGFGRLNLVRDHDRNIVKKICYTYQGLLAPCGEVVVFTNDQQSQAFTKNNCAAGGNPSSPVTYTVPAGKYSSTASKQDANNKAIAEITANGQNYANANASCTFYNSARSQSFTRNNCAAGGTPSTVTYTVAAGKYSSTASQADADAQAQNDISANGQNYANANASCTFYNSARSQSFTRNNCAAGGSPATVTYSVSAGKYSSTASQADADAQAQNDINANGQNYANANASCTFYNSTRSQPFTRNNCDAGGNPSTVTYRVAAGKYSSTASQADADGLAQNDINVNGQNYANANASCTFYNSARSQSFTRNNCAAGGSPATVTYSVTAGKYSSTVSQADADAQAQNDINANGQNYANANGSCTFYNQARSQNIAKNDCPSGGEPSSVTYTIPQGKYSSTISQDDANAKAQDEINTNGQSNANTNGHCTFYSAKASIVLQKNDCPSGHGSEVTYTVPDRAYTSTVSQGDANDKAMADLRQNAQRYANDNGSCLYGNDYMSQWFTKNNCPTGYEGTPVSYTVPADKYIAATKTAANQLAQNEINGNGQTNANNNGSCKLVEACPGCTGDNLKCINSVCTPGTKVYTQSIQISPNNFQCTYHYEWPDGTWSGNYTEMSTTDCQGSVGN